MSIEGRKKFVTCIRFYNIHMFFLLFNKIFYLFKYYRLNFLKKIKD